MPLLISLQEAARLLSCDEKTIRRRISDGTLAGYRVGPRALRVDRVELESKLIRRLAAVIR